MNIKFRVWDKKNNRMGVASGIMWKVGCDENINIITENQESIIFSYIDDNGNFESYGLEKGKYILLQYTGLKDKNGKEIYEGDIVQTEYDGEIIIQEVIDKRGCWMPFYWKRTHGIDYQQEDLIDFCEFEVIGNKFKNQKDFYKKFEELNTK